MSFRAVVIPDVDISPLDEALFDGRGRLRLLPAEEFRRWSHATIQAWCVQRARYCVPTLELADCIRQLIGASKAIEIASGFGDLGRHLAVRMTDSAMQTAAEIRSLYAMLGQPIIDPPSDVERIDGLDAVRRYKPETVVASWCTQRYQPGDEGILGNPERPKIGSSVQGVDELELLKLVRLYVHVGNESVHGDKRARALPHREIRGPWLISRAIAPERNVIYVWEQ